LQSEQTPLEQVLQFIGQGMHELLDN